jgi:hypothetical protein
LPQKPTVAKIKNYLHRLAAHNGLPELEQLHKIGLFVVQRGNAENGNLWSRRTHGDLGLNKIALATSAIGMKGFEPSTPSSRTRCATKLRYIP